MCNELKPHVDKWLLLTNPTVLPDTLIKDQVPILLCDPIMLFLTIILNNPNRLHRLTYQTIVNAYFNLVYIQNIIKEMMIKSLKPIIENKCETELTTIDDYQSFIYKRLTPKFFEEYDSKYEKLLVSMIFQIMNNNKFFF